MAGKKGMKWGMKLKTPCGIEALRAQIEANLLIGALKKHVLGDSEMSATQVTAAVALLRKVLPDKAETEHTGESVVRHVLDSDAILGRLLPDAPAASAGTEAQEPLRH
jgi:hypothetical protein